VTIFGTVFYTKA